MTTTARKTAAAKLTDEAAERVAMMGKATPARTRRAPTKATAPKSPAAKAPAARKTAAKAAPVKTDTTPTTDLAERILAHLLIAPAGTYATAKALGLRHGTVYNKIRRMYATGALVMVTDKPKITYGPPTAAKKATPRKRAAAAKK